VVDGLSPDFILQKYPSPSDYLQGDLTKVTTDMTQVATREAIEAALLDLIGRGTEMGLWERAPRYFIAAAHQAGNADKDTPSENVAQRPRTPKKPSADHPVAILPGQQPPARTTSPTPQLRLSYVAE